MCSCYQHNFQANERKIAVTHFLKDYTEREGNATLQITNLCRAPVKAPITHHSGSSLQARQAMQNQKDISSV